MKMDNLLDDYKTPTPQAMVPPPINAQEGNVSDHRI